MLRPSIGTLSHLPAALSARYRRASTQVCCVYNFVTTAALAISVSKLFKYIILAAP